jgi:phytoene/squalene synthetase
VGSAPGSTAVPVADAGGLRRQERAENFPVALRVLPAPVRADLRSVYDLARRIDDAGDDARCGPDQRLARLDRLEAEITATYAGTPRAALFLDLVAANRQDQTVRRYATYADLRGYCRLSADPVGRLVLDVFGIADDETARLSDLVCTALQVLEHCQDVAEDRRDHDRVYLPAEDLARFGVIESDLDASAASPASSMRRARS